MFDWLTRRSGGIREGSPPDEVKYTLPYLRKLFTDLQLNKHVTKDNFVRTPIRAAKPVVVVSIPSDARSPARRFVR